MRIVILLGPNGRQRTYPVPDGIALQDHYELDGDRFTVVDVRPAPNGALSPDATTPVARLASL